MDNTVKKDSNKDFGASGFCIAVFLFILFFCSAKLFGLKFIVGAIISWVTGAVIWFLKILFQPASDEEGVDKPFPWLLFLMFPLFIPLSLPSWLIPFILIVVYFLAVVAFGGHGNHIFNPVIVAVVFMLSGYSYLAVTGATRPFPAGVNGYTVYTAGVPPTADIRDVFASVPAEMALQISMNGSLPNIPGSCFSGYILFASFLYALIFRRRLVWWFMAVGSVCTFAWIFPKNPDFAIPPINVLLLGIMPSLILCAVSDFNTIPETHSRQVINAILFGAFTVFIALRSNEILAPCFGFLLTQIVSPLIEDILCPQSKISIQTEETE